MASAKKIDEAKREILWAKWWVEQTNDMHMRAKAALIQARDALAQAKSE